MSFEPGEPTFKHIKMSFEQVIINLKYKHFGDIEQVKESFEQATMLFEQGIGHFNKWLLLWTKMHQTLNK